MAINVTKLKMAEEIYFVCENMLTTNTSMY